MKNRRSYFREWRKYRHLTQAQVVDRLAVHDDDKLPRTAASLSRIETGDQIYTQRILEALADIYDCEAWELLGRDPAKENRVIDMVARLDENRQKQIEAFIIALDGTNG